MSARPRSRNPRGEGSRLRDEIVAAALALIDDMGPEAVSLRAVARQAGISAPSIYDHFADRENILDAVITTCFADLSTAIITARDEADEPVQRLEAGCRAYLAYAERCPHRYAVMFRMARPPASPDDAQSNAAAFGTLVDAIVECVTAGRSSSTDPFSDAVALWSGLHGFAGLTATQAGFPWPDRDAVIRRIILGQARISEVRDLGTSGR